MSHEVRWANDTELNGVGYCICESCFFSESKVRDFEVCFHQSTTPFFPPFSKHKCTLLSVKDSGSFLTRGLSCVKGCCNETCWKAFQIVQSANSSHIGRKFRADKPACSLLPHCLWTNNTECAGICTNNTGRSGS